MKVWIGFSWLRISSLTGLVNTVMKLSVPYQADRVLFDEVRLLFPQWVSVPQSKVSKSYKN
jgi:hypothetical protein